MGETTRFLCAVCAEGQRPMGAVEEIAFRDAGRIAELSAQDSLHACVRCGLSPVEVVEHGLSHLVETFGAWPLDHPVGWLVDEGRAAEKAARAAAREARRAAAKERHRRRKALARARQAQRRKAKRQARRALRKLRGVRPDDVFGRDAAWEDALYVEA